MLSWLANFVSKRSTQEWLFSVAKQSQDSEAESRSSESYSPSHPRNFKSTVTEWNPGGVASCGTKWTETYTAQMQLKAIFCFSIQIRTLRSFYENPQFRLSREKRCLYIKNKNEPGGGGVWGAWYRSGNGVQGVTWLDWRLTSKLSLRITAF